MKDNNVRIGRRAALHAAVGIASLTPLDAAKTDQCNGRRTAPDLQTPIVETVSGKVRGFASSGVAIFRCAQAMERRQELPQLRPLLSAGRDRHH